MIVRRNGNVVTFSCSVGRVFAEAFNARRQKLERECSLAWLVSSSGRIVNTDCTTRYFIPTHVVADVLALWMTAILYDKEFVMIYVR